MELKNNQEFIESFNNLRFPLILFVIIIHCNLTSVSLHGINLTASFPPWYFHIMYFFSEALTRLAVPVFFIISGYLFFYKIDTFNITIYKEKLRRRIHSLLIPYIIWNLTALVIIVIKSQIPSIFPSLASEPHNLTWFYSSFWAIESCPINYPLWYVRDLMVVLVLSPIIYFVIKKFKAKSLIVLFLVWFLGTFNFLPGFGPTSFFFFSLGAYINIYGVKFIDYTKIFFILYILLAVLDSLFLEASFNWIIHKTTIIFGVIAMFSLAIKYRGKIRIPVVYTNSVLFILCFHSLFNSEFSKVLIKISNAEQPLEFIAIYITTIIVTTFTCIQLYKIIKHFLPNILLILTGGRI